MTTNPLDHQCHATDCEIEISPRLLMCRRHWYMVPKPIRDQIWAEYRPGQENDKNPSMAYLRVMQAAIDAVAEKEGKL